MVFRAPMRSLQTEKAKPKTTASMPVKSPIQVATEMEPVAALMHELEALKIKLETIVAEAEQKANERIAAIKIEHVGEKGDKGDTPVINQTAIAHHAASLVPKVDEEKIITRVIEATKPDEKKIAKLAARHVAPAEPGRPGKDADPAAVMENILQMFKEGKVKLNADHVEGLHQKLNSIDDLVRRHHGIRGGGDTVAAGTNVTITRLASGQVQINASGGGPAIPSGTVNGTNNTFIASSTPNIVITEGGHYTNGFGVTITGTTIVFDAGLQPQNWIYYI